MAKVIILSRKFPAYHKKAGKDTYFVEGFLKGLPEIENYKVPTDLFSEISLALDIWQTLMPKYHTIRAGKRFKPGDKFSPRIWAGKPYRSKQIIIAPDIEVKKTWDIEIAIGMEGINLNGDWYFEHYKELLNTLSENDGLSVEDFESWFNKPSFVGQIICWNEKVQY